MAGNGGGGDAAGAAVGGVHQGSAEGDGDVVRGEGREGIEGAAVGVEQDAGGVGGLGEEEVEKGWPRSASVQGQGAAESDGEFPLDAECGPLGFGDAAGEGAVETGFADACPGVGEEEAFQSVGPAGGGFGGVPGMEAVGEAELQTVGKMAFGESGGGFPVGFAGGGGVDVGDTGFAGAAEDGVEMGGETGIVEMAVGVGVGHWFSAGRELRKQEARKQPIRRAA